MKKYSTLFLEILLFQEADIIRTSDIFGAEEESGATSDNLGGEGADWLN